jgi:hypothetical protein
MTKKKEEAAPQQPLTLEQANLSLNRLAFAIHKAISAGGIFNTLEIPTLDDSIGVLGEYLKQTSEQSCPKNCTKDNKDIKDE